MGNLSHGFPGRVGFGAWSCNAPHQTRPIRNVPMIVVVRVLIAASALTLMAAAPSPRILNMHGLDPVRLGMSVEDAEKALGTVLMRSYQSASTPCAYYERADGADTEVAYMVENGRISRIDVFLPDIPTRSPPVSTSQGVGLNSTEDEIK